MKRLIMILGLAAFSSVLGLAQSEPVILFDYIGESNENIKSYMKSFNVTLKKDTCYKDPNWCSLFYGGYANEEYFSVILFFTETNNACDEIKISLIATYALSMIDGLDKHAIRIANTEWISFDGKKSYTIETYPVDLGNKIEYRILLSYKKISDLK